MQKTVKVAYRVIRSHTFACSTHLLWVNAYNTEGMTPREHETRDRPRADVVAIMPRPPMCPTPTGITEVYTTLAPLTRSSTA